MHLPSVLLLFSCSLSLSWAGVILENGGPILWSHATAQLNDLPVTDGALTPDPWHYLHRMSLYRLIIAATDPYMSSMGEGENQSPLWGLPLQLGWMLTSGRLADPTGATNCGIQSGDAPDMCISPNSWWSCVNYFTSVLPFLSAANNGYMGEGVLVQMQIPAGVEGYCTTYDSCKTAHADVMEKWDKFFLGLKHYNSEAVTDMPVNEKKDHILGLYWSANSASSQASSACSEKMNAYSGEEKAFAHSWQKAGEYVAATYFQSSISMSAPFMAPLPGRVLKEGDSAPNIADLTDDENHSLKIFSWMSTADTLMGGNLVGMWRSVMCSVQARENGREMIRQLLLDPTYAPSSFAYLITTMSTCTS